MISVDQCLTDLDLPQYEENKTMWAKRRIDLKSRDVNVKVQFTHTGLKYLK